MTEKVFDLRQAARDAEILPGCADCISRQAAIKAADSIIERDISGNNDVVKAMNAWKEYIKGLPPAQSELENKIRAIGYTGKEGQIYIGGRLFVVRELPQ